MSRRELDRVHHLVLRRAGMDAVSFDADPHLGGGEGLVVDPADLGAVERVREVGAEPLDVEVVDAPADLLVDGEADADRCMVDVGMRREVRDRTHDLGNAGLVVGTEQRRAVRRDDVVALALCENRVLARA